MRSLKNILIGLFLVASSSVFIGCPDPGKGGNPPPPPNTCIPGQVCGVGINGGQTIQLRVSGHDQQDQYLELLEDLYSPNDPFACNKLIFVADLYQQGFECKLLSQRAPQIILTLNSSIVGPGTRGSLTFITPTLHVSSPYPRNIGGGRYTFSGDFKPVNNNSRIEMWTQGFYGTRSWNEEFKVIILADPTIDLNQQRGAKIKIKYTGTLLGEANL